MTLKPAILYLCIYIVIIAIGCKPDEELQQTNISHIFYSESNKLWAHKIYTPQEANIALQQFSGLETDIVFVDSILDFDIRHEVIDTFRNRNLDSFFCNIEHVTDFYYWLDFKNLTSENCDAAIARLKSISTKYNLQNKIIVESQNADLLYLLKNDSIATSYWVAEFNMFDSVQYHNQVLTISKLLSEGVVDALSAHYSLYPIINANFPNANIHVWTNGLITEKDKEIIQMLDAQENIRVILVDYSTNFLK